ncbi:MAG TPA: HepT-like ribonuclease domain-containing protein [candidate division Zixibacteria bacterium]|jgi:uncharacterized protein with HEPN domain
MRRDRDRLQDIIEAIEAIEKYTARGKDNALGDELVNVWIVHHLQTIGEAARLLSPELKEQRPDIPWSKVVGMRNLLVHEYFMVDTEAVWMAVERDLPSLKGAVTSLLSELP